MKRLKHLIFDCDGVLVNSEIIAARIEVEVKCEMGFPITLEEQIQKFVGHGFSGPVMQEEIKKYPANFWSIVDQRTKEAYRKELKPLDGVLDVLHSSAHQKCVASSSRAEWLKYKLELTDLHSFFPNAVFSGNDVEKCKPAPDLFQHAMKKMNWHSEDCLVVEDSVAGVTAGKAAGLVVCAFVGGEHILPGQAEKLIQAGADYVVSDIRSVLRIMTSL